MDVTPLPGPHRRVRQLYPVSFSDRCGQLQWTVAQSVSPRSPRPACHQRCGGVPPHGRHRPAPRRVDGDHCRGAGAGARDQFRRGSTPCPAAQTPKLLVRPVASTVTKPASLDLQPLARRSARGRSTGHAGHQPRHLTVDDLDPRVPPTGRVPSSERTGVGEEDDVVGRLPHELCMLGGAGVGA